MSCKIPYIEQRFRDVNPSLADTLNTKYSQIWDSVIESELFKKEEDTGKYLMATTNISRLQEQQDFIDKVNQDNSVPEGASVIENLNGYVNVNVLNLPEVTGVSTPAIKEGVEELFDSNPELANQVYEALGFEVEQGNLRQQIKNIADNSEYEHNKRLAEYLLDFNFGKNDFFRFAEDFAENFEEFGLYYKDENGVKNISIKVNKIAKEIPLSNRQYFEEQVLLHETIHLLTVDNLNKSKEIKKEISKLMQVAKSKLDVSKYNNAFSSEAEFIAHVFSDYNFQKELKSIPYEKSNVWNKFISLIQDMAKYLGINVENSLLEKIVEVSQPLFNKQITPQQKQQALQVYSSYLDTIFPDSKVKDIVYHGSNAKFDKFNKSNLPDSGIYFDKNKATAYGYGNVLIPAILNSSGYYYGGSLNKVNSKQIRENGETGLTNGSGNIVFEPEQIHILGSKQDIEGFKEFVNKQPKPTIDYTSLDVTASLDAETKAKIDYLRNNDDLTVQC